MEMPPRCQGARGAACPRGARRYVGRRAMTELPPLPFTAPIGAYLDQARSLLADLHAGDEAAAWRFKWEHPRFRDRKVGDVKSAALDLEDATLMTARGYAFESWND